MNRSGRMLLSVAVGLVAVSALLSACGGGGSSSSSETSGGAEAGSTAPASSETTGGSGVEAAKEIVAEYKPGQPLKIEPLGKKPPTGISVADVNCNVPTCSPGSLKKAVAALGWKYEDYNFDVEKGPQDFVRQFEGALAAHPDYISLTETYGSELAAPLLAKAKQEGIPVVGVSALEKGPGMIGIVRGPNSEAKKMGEITAALAISEVGGGAHFAIANDKALPLFGPIVEGAEQQIEEDGEGATAEKLELSLAKTPQENTASAVSFLQAHPEVNALYYPYTIYSVGAYQQLKAAGLLERVKVFISYPAEADLPAIKSGEVTAGMAGEEAYPWRTADMMARNSIGEPIEEFEAVAQFRTVKAENATPEALNAPDYQSVYEEAWNVGG